jgi:hypothetical protein
MKQRLKKIGAITAATLVYGSAAAFLVTVYTANCCAADCSFHTVLGASLHWCGV